ncbi:aldose 1-epimerase family protein [Sphingomonas montanisoli]|uniref:Aldose 1-epimerase family protein n=1 Tax=Sphingomonas montanisoli TaxID=2606412 RepID=A0A5D9C5A1_9SPHN|nr:aldose 1-epimerase family protein [Sphingomonas montanisoli]TZG26407.1 aldose 1-epimerase family protein [Sphingomonas montanisoli]
MTPVRIASAGVAAEIAPLGAELVRVTDAHGRDWQWGGDPAVWAGRAPILFPIVGTLRDDMFRWKGRSYSLPRHGFARRSTFEIIDRAEDRVTLRLESSETTLAVWPFAFQLDMIYAVAGTTLTMTAIVRNPSADPIPASFGYHPALLWPLPGDATRDAHEIRFDKPEPAAVRRLDADGLVDPEPRPTPIEGDRLALSDSLFAEDALILDQPASDRLVYGAPGGGRVAVGYAGMRQIAFWQKPGAGYLCIEPWHGLSDPADFDGDIFDKPGMAIIEGGGEKSFTMTIELMA